MATMATPQRMNVQAPTAKIKTLLNNQLKNILKAENLKCSGVKAQMQARIITQLEEYARKGNYGAFERLQHLIYNPDSPARFSLPPVGSPAGAAYSPMLGAGSPIGMPPQLHRGPIYPSPGGHAPARLAFRESPFYIISEPLTHIIDFPVMPNNRHTLHAKVIFSPTVCERLRADANLRVMVYCAGESPLSPYTKLDIGFPHQMEIKVNQDEVRANLRGLKNKPGSTRPADITDLLRKIPNYENSVMVTYALTHKKFSMVINLVKKQPVEELVKKLASGNVISKERVIREMVTKADDPDIVTTSTVMSLKCPLSTLRMELPCRSTVCTHNQCFDATSFLQLQEQAPTWTCPLCNKTVLFESLAVDQYVKEILAKTSKSVEQVTIEPSGMWSLSAKPSPSPRQNGSKYGTAAAAADDDDDLVEIKDARVSSVKNESTPVPPIMSRTPPLSSREPSAASAPPPQAKRKIDDVIDLTGSDDEEEPPRGPKRQAIHATPRGIAELRNGGYHESSGHARPNGTGFVIHGTSNTNTPDPFWQ
ncbi:hypothetical protein L228DRAFT_262302 [Xylona heveae TC161]|uniref:Uncharacterized protein n=1 Tax=Xylona heveae (strain CBS 132557 / TC161) TaxID=1328760 RepID=A0A165FQV5_XYLHT|nr:hypothetical protein L228DRAFT_262302 [Xylona heveae TC161]KZF21267.1 hypothetical protein L228DRAFT_262302 [Xylona heveae TC161]